MSDMYVYMYSMYVCMHVCTKSFLKTTTNSSCVCTHLANKADSDSEKCKCIVPVFIFHPSFNLLQKRITTISKDVSIF